MAFASVSISHRCRRTQTDNGLRRTWITTCGRFRVSEFTQFGGRRIYYAERLEDTATGHCWEIISQHRSRQQAINSLLRYTRTETGRDH